MAVKFSQADIDHIIKLRTVDNLGIKQIGKVFGVGYKPIHRVLRESGIDVTSIKLVEFSESDKQRIIEAYESGIGAGGIHRHLGLECSEMPVIRFLKSQYGTLRGRSEQQSARMARSTPEEIAHLTKAAHKAVRGRKRPRKEGAARAKSLEGKLSWRSKYEPIVFNSISQHFPDAFPGKAVDIYNIDIAVGNVAVEVFGGGWSISDPRRVDRYIARTKKLGELGYHTIFVLLGQGGRVFDASKLIREIKIASSLPSSIREYRVIWGDTYGAIGLCSDIDNSAFVCPFINVRDRATGRYVSVPREA